MQGTDRSPFDVFIQVEGDGICISAQNLHRAMEQSPTLLKCLLRYAHTFDVQASFTPPANARGSISERLARWLLMARDRLDDDDMLPTHEFLALMLGVRRAGVTLALQEFERKALVTRARGIVTIKDRDGLEEHANGLNGPPEAEFERLFG